MNFLDQSN